MGLLDKIKNRVLGRKEDDLNDIRSYVTGDDQYDRQLNDLGPQQPPEEDVMPPSKPWEGQSLEPTRTDPLDLVDDRRDLSLGQQDQHAASGNSYDISEKLNMIESQLSAIRSQTETINERLKNLEMKLGSGRRF
jgi:hypothetical protein